MKRGLILFLFSVATSAQAANITGAWFTNGTIKLPQEYRYPNVTCSTCVTTRNWDGTTAKMFGARNETVFGVFYLWNGSGSPATQVNVQISSFTGPLGNGIVPLVVSSGSVWNAALSGPVNLFYVRYLPIRGMTQESWDPTEYEERDLPMQFRIPYTVSGGGQGAPIVATQLWANRTDHDKHYPDILVPMEEMLASSFTVSASASQGIGLDVYIGKTLPSGTYTATLTVREGATVSMTIPISLEVKNFTLPDAPALPVLVATGGGNINLFHQNTEFPGFNTTDETTRKHYYQFFRRHGMIPIGDYPFEYANNGAENYPTPEYAAQLDGTLFSTAQGYAGRGVDLPVPFYMLGTYRNWDIPGYWSTTSLTGPDGFCTNISSWSFNLGRDFPGIRTAFYTFDEPDPATVVDTVEKYATWIATACPMTGTKINTWATVKYTVAYASAPHLNMPSSTDWIGSGFPNSQATWQTRHDYYATQGSTQAWAYNGHPSWNGSMYATEDDGVSSMVFALADYKMGIQGHFLWNGTNFKNSNNLPQINDLFNDAHTFGEDLYPSTSSIRGRHGNHYSNGDGVLAYPGHNTQDPTNDYGFDGPMPSLRLKLVRAAIQYYDYLSLAGAINSTATTSVLSDLVPEILWEHKCVNDVSGLDCSYSWGGRKYSADPNLWEVDRESLADVIASGGLGTSTHVTGGGGAGTSVDVTGDVSF